MVTAEQIILVIHDSAEKREGYGLQRAHLISSDSEAGTTKRWPNEVTGQRTVCTKDPHPSNSEDKVFGACHAL